MASTISGTTCSRGASPTDPRTNGTRPTTVCSAAQTSALGPGCRVPSAASVSLRPKATVLSWCGGHPSSINSLVETHCCGGLNEGCAGSCTSSECRTRGRGRGRTTESSFPHCFLCQLLSFHPLLPLVLSGGEEEGGRMYGLGMTTAWECRGASVVVVDRYGDQGARRAYAGNSTGLP